MKLQRLLTLIRYRHAKLNPYKPILYISGPMTGWPGYNHAAFNRAAKYWRSLGNCVINPAENFNGNKNLPREVYMRRDIHQVLQAERIISLPGSASSAGATLEQAIARELKIPIMQH